RSLRVLDGAVTVFDGKMGVEPQSETVWHQADKYNVPRVCFANKVNLVGGSLVRTLESIRERLDEKAFLIWYLIGEGEENKGFVDLVTQKGYLYKGDEGLELEEIEIPEDMKDEVAKYREEMIEHISDADDELAEKYLEGEELSVDEIRAALRKGVIAGKLKPVMGGDGRKAVVQKLLDYVVALLPSPLDIGNAEGTNPKTGEVETREVSDDAPLSGLAFKVARDPFVGRLVFYRIYSGTLESGSYIYNATKGEKERVGRVLLMHANEREERETVEAGNIAAIVGLKNTTTGDTLCDPDNQIVLEEITFPEPVISIAVEPKTKADQEKMANALRELAEEDPTFHVRSDEETAQTVISGMGELHLDIIVDRMKREFSVEANVGAPQVAYKETIKDTVEVEGKFVKQSGGRGQYGHVWLRLEPQEPGAGFEFANEIKGGTIPSEYIPSVQKGIEEAMTGGVIAGYPVIDLKATLYDGSFHDVDSSEAAFKIAGSMALKAGVKQAKPAILEPMMNVEVTMPEEAMGDIIGDLNSKRGNVDEMTDSGNLKLVKATVPLSSMFGYATQLRSISQGRANYSMEFGHYQEVPSNVAQEIAAKFSGSDGE
ncbi:MAG: elongation factor G, partial [Bdellovibrionales bacterium]|nr:elongation factor G [Bdellovibrionales bacterium]